MKLFEDSTMRKEIVIFLLVLIFMFFDIFFFIFLFVVLTVLRLIEELRALICCVTNVLGEIGVLNQESH